VSQAPKSSPRRNTPHSGQFLSSPRGITSAVETYGGVCQYALRGLTEALGRQAEIPRIAEIVTCLMEGWAEQRVPDLPPRASRIGDDHSPFEYSLAFEPAGVDLRLLLEAQGTPPSAVGNLQAALELNHRLSKRFGADLTRFDAVADLFLEETTGEPFSLWHAIGVGPDQQVEFKLYLNPQTRGKALAFPLIHQTLSRLGFSDAALACVNRAMPRRRIDELGYFSLDMSDAPEARVKVYISHPHVTADELDTLFEVCPNHRRGDVIRFCEAMTERAGTFDSKPLMSCLSFVGGEDVPSSVTLHLPIAHYIENDQVTCDRFSALLKDNGLDHEAYQRGLQAIARRPLSRGPGLQSYASFRRQGEALRMTAYFSSELFSRP
jgi:DMATS type aromatic prenyltransferase